MSKNIMSMNEDELKAEQRRLVKRFTIKTTIVVAAAVATHIAVNVLVKKLENNDTED